MAIPAPQTIKVVQDRSPIHTSHRVREWAQLHPEIEFLDWPTKGCDLNPIEHLWGIMVQDWDIGQRGAPRKQLRKLKEVFVWLIMYPQQHYNRHIFQHLYETSGTQAVHYAGIYETQLYQAKAMKNKIWFISKCLENKREKNLRDKKYTFLECHPVKQFRLANHAKKEDSWIETQCNRRHSNGHSPLQINTGILERSSEVQWPQEYWTTLIQSKLIGRAQKVYVTLDESLSSDYDNVKAIVLKAYELVPEAYRQRFRNLQKDREQTFVEFARGKRQYAEDWLKSKEVDNFEGLKELVLVEEFKRCVPDKLKVHLEELKIDTLQEVAIASDEYYLSHKNELGVMSNIKPGCVRKRILKLAIVNRFPVKDVDIVLGNDVAYKNKQDPILMNREIAVVTRSRASGVDAAESTTDVDCSSLERSISSSSGSNLVVDRNIAKDLPNWTKEELIKAQKQEFRDLPVESGEVDDLTVPKFKIINNILYRLSRPREAGNSAHEVLKQILVPYVHRIGLMSLAHDNGLAGHFGIHKTAGKLLKDYYWPKLKSDVKKFVNSCSICQKVGKPNQVIPKAPLCPIPVVSEPFKEIIIDVVGPLPRTRSGNEYIFTMMDKMSRYPESIPLRSIKSVKFVESGCSGEVSSNSEIDDQEILSSHGSEWDKELPYLLFAFRSAPSQSLGLSPFNLVFGHCVRGPLDVVRESWEGDIPDINLLDYLTNLGDKMTKAWEFARENLLCSQRRMKYFFDRKTKIRNFAEGDKVLVLLPLPEEEFNEDKYGNDGNFPTGNKTSLKNFDSSVSHLSFDKRRSLKKLVFDYKELFSDVPGRTSVLEHDVDVGNATPVKQSPYRLNPFKSEVVAKEVEYMLKHGLIEPSKSPWSSPVVLVKKSDGEFRMCFDYRRVNEVTKPDSYPLPRIEDCIDRMGKSKYKSKFDLLKGYCDDWDTHLKRIKALFEVLKKAGLVVNLKKSEFAKAKVVYLGHVVGDGKVTPKQANVEAIEKISVPERRRDVRKFLGTPVKIMTDHNPLTFINRYKNKNQHLMRWSIMLQEWNLQFSHIPGRDNVVADALSRSVGSPTPSAPGGRGVVNVPKEVVDNCVLNLDLGVST
ncbi:uncharacterized protein [Macrobrachium rosenbergii]|uniref:uncharacterized protein n=1 Tax=Macrobrachium rosenbergii TaxID=79674 RepID=UPI0034D7290F